MATTDEMERDSERTTSEGYLGAEFITSREAYWTTLTAPVYGGCSDDRELTSQSAEMLSMHNPDGLPTDKGYASVFGGLAGAAKNVLVVGAAMHGPEFIKRVGGVADVMDELIARSRVDTAPTAVRYLLHSAEGNENTDGSFCMHGGMPTGCAYCGGIGATSALLVHPTESLIRETGRLDQVAAFGTDDHFDDLLTGHQLVLEHGTEGKGAEYIFDRSMYVKRVEANMPMMILAGKHTDAKRTGLIHSFALDEVGSASRAAADGKRFYRQDIGVITNDLLRKLPDYQLDAELLMRAFLLDSTPVRAVLVAGDDDPELNGHLVPKNLPIGFRGDARETLQAIGQAA